MNDDSNDDYAKAIDELRTRCATSRAELEERNQSDGTIYYRLTIPNGRDTRGFGIFNLERVKNFLALPFETVTFVGDYEAICRYDEKEIEASIRSGPNSTSIATILQTQDDDDERDNEAEPQSLEITDPDFAPNARIVIGPATDLFDLIGSRMSRHRDRKGISVRLIGFAFTNHDEAVTVLERVCHALFFQIELTHNVTISLRRDRRIGRIGRGCIHVEPTVKDITFPHREFDTGPITLYWYAVGARGMPLLQFLAFYQTIEFYFPTYSEADARRRVQNVLKDPAFRADRDADVARIVSSVAGSDRQGADERSSLRATVRECVDRDELRAVLESSDETRTTFSGRIKGLTDVKVPIADTNADLRDAVADRIYDIRCRIVHTKSPAHDGSKALLLPFSQEEKLMYADIELLRFVARKVLIAGSSELHT